MVVIQSIFGASVITQDFVDSYSQMTPPWGFNGMGEVVYLRTYSRKKDNGLNETWPETIQRVINGAIKIGTPYTQQDAEALFDHMFHLRCSTSGRALWQMGTPLVEKFGAGSLNNCFFLNIDSIESFEMMFSYLMLGGGVGFSVERDKIHDFPKVKSGVIITHERTNDADFIVSDSREGWGRLLHAILKSYFYTGKSFSYSTMLVREYGAILNTFGGTASGPGALIEGIAEICAVLEGRAGKKIRSVDALDIANIIGKIVVSGSSRRSAEIALGDPDDILFLRAKNWASGEIPGWRENSNNSILADSYEEIIPQFWKGYDGSGEPYGLMNRKLMRKVGRLGELNPDPSIDGMNPCVVGSTLVAVADGRGGVPIQELAEAGLDVPVYTFDGEKVVVRTMRNPRLTGKSVPVMKVTLDSGDTFTATPNHKMVLRDGSRVQVSELKSGDSLRIVSRYQSAFVPGSFRRNRQPYWNLAANGKAVGEHRLVAGFHAGVDRIPSNLVVHHKDRVSTNNDPSNLEIMTVAAHDALHGNEVHGDRNPMRRGFDGEFGQDWIDAYSEKMSEAISGELNGKFSGFSHEALREHAITLSISVGRRASTEEWMEYAKAHGLPRSFSGWRKSHLNGISGFLKNAAVELGFEHVDADQRTVRALRERLSEGYDAFILENTVAYNKNCEICGEPFVTKQRETGICSSACNIRRLASQENIDKRMESIHQIWAAKHESLREAQAKIHNDLCFALGRHPLKTEWKSACKSLDVSDEISRVSSPFRSYADLAEASSNYNHKVVSVEDAGFADVYNGTVDEFHTFFLGGWSTTTKTGKPKESYVLSVQCGEIGLAHAESCNLSTISLPVLNSYEEFLEISRLLYMMQKTITTLAYPFEKTTTITRKNRRLGQNVTGIAQCTEEQLSWLAPGYEALKELDKNYSLQYGLSESIRLTCIQPGGTQPLMLGVTSATGPADDEYYIRRIRFGSNDPLVNQLRKRGYNVSPEIGLDGKVNHTRLVVDFPCKSADNAKLFKDTSAVDQMELIKRIQTDWADNAISATVKYRPEELKDIKAWLSENYEDSVKSISFLLHTGHGFIQAPYEGISKEEYEKLSMKLDYSIPLTGAFVDEMIDISCEAGGSCPIR